MKKIFGITMERKIRKGDFVHYTGPEDKFKNMEMRVTSVGRFGTVWVDHPEGQTFDIAELKRRK